MPTTPQVLPDKKLGAFRVFVHDIHVTGSTVFSDAELAEATAPYRNRELTTEDLEKVRLALTLLYVNRGYLTSGAVIPDQDVSFGTIVIQIVEGTLARIDVEGNQWFRSTYVRDRVARGLSTPSVSIRFRNGYNFFSKIPVSNESMRNSSPATFAARAS